MDTSESRAKTIERNGVRLSYSVEGEGSPLLLLQGVGLPGHAWRPQVDVLRERFRVVTVDNRGVGGSSGGPEPLTIDDMAADAAAILDSENIDHAHVMGHSMGGLIALRFALMNPARIKSLVLAATFADGAAPTKFSWRMTTLGIRCRVGTRRMRRQAMLDMIMPAHYLRSIDRDQLAADLQLLFGRDLAEQPPIVMRQLRAMAGYSAVAHLRMLDGIPTLVVSGTHDPIAPPALGRAIAGGISSARFVEFTDASHALPIQCAARYNELIMRHLAAAEDRPAPKLPSAIAALST
ncbi:MAG TPA: alpha/beta hydrolase, partial [Vicinamibacterales bacterium]|nr:alpha/beta hydrolase [Vicinamibacterales bacterium]